MMWYQHSYFWAGIFIGANVGMLLMALLAMAHEGDHFSGWGIVNAERTRWRTLDSIGCPDWTDNRDNALCFSLREHAEAFAADDPEDVRIVHMGVTP